MAIVTTRSGQGLHVEETGIGPPVLFVHGWAMASGIFDGLAARVGSGRRAVRYDLRGHGRSGPASRASLDDHAGDLADLFDSLDLDGAVVVAWSLGGHVALRALPALGRRVRALVLVGATPRFTEGPDWSHGLPARQVEVLAQRFRRDPARTRARFLADLFTPGERESLGAAALAAVDGRLPLPDPAAALAGLDLLATADLRPGLGAIVCPVLALHGAADPICLPGAAAALAGAIPGARLALVEGAGHLPFVTREAEVAEAVLAFAGALR